MTLAQKVRDALKGKSLTAEQIATAIGEPLKYYVNQIIKPPELITTVIEGVKHYSLADDNIAQNFGGTAPRTAKKKASKRAKKHTRKPRRVKGFKAEARERMRQLAKKHTRRPAPAAAAPAIRDIALANYMAIVDGLIATVRHEVEDIDNCPPLATQLANVARAKTLYEAAPV